MISFRYAIHPITSGTCRSAKVFLFKKIIPKRRRVQFPPANVLNTKGFCSRYEKDPLQKAWERLSYKKKIEYAVTGIAVILAGSVIFVWYQAVTLHQRLQLTNNVFEIEKHKPFIYLRKRDRERYSGKHGDADHGQKAHLLLKETLGKLLPWIESKTDDPWVLLNLAQSTDRKVRLIGLKAITKDHNWDDFIYRYISQSCDDRTMVSLARMPDADSRLFRGFPKLPPPKNDIEDEFHYLLGSFPKDGVDPCLSIFTSKALLTRNIEAEKAGMIGFGGTGIEFIKSISRIPDDTVESFCLDAIARHSAVREHCVQIVQQGGLQLLQRVYLEKPKNTVLHTLIAWILGNISLDPELRKSVIDGGWVSLLQQWTKSRDPALYFHSVRALVNLDQDKHINATFEDGIYLAHPIHKQMSEVKVDIVLVHGLMGGPFKTWRQQDRIHVEGREVLRDKDYVANYTFCWPKDWLAKDCPDIRIVSVGFDTEISQWNAKCRYNMQKRSISQRSAALIEKLMAADIGSRPIIWLGHSMGGLLIKKMLEIAKNDPKYEHIFKKTRGVLFYSTPHRGSTIAKYSSYGGYVLSPSIEVQELRKDNPMLLELHKSFVKLMEENKIPCLSFGETEKTSFGLKVTTLIVPLDSSDPGIGDFYKLPLNHINVCKPWDKDSEVYLRTLEFIQKCIIDSGQLKKKKVHKLLRDFNK